MDYLPPPEKQVLICQASEKLLAERSRPVYHYFGVGMIRDMPFSNGWDIPIPDEQVSKYRILKPGQRAILLRAKNAAAPIVYCEQHKPCSMKTFAAFNQLMKTNPIGMLTATQLQSVSELLGKRVTDKTMHTQAYVDDIGGRRGINIFSGRIADNKMGRAFLFVSDASKRMVQEVGYEGASFKEDRYKEDCEDMLKEIKFTKP